MAREVKRTNGYLDSYQTGRAFAENPARFDLDAAWQRLLQLPLGLLGILAISLLLLAISLPRTTNATVPGPALTTTPTVTPSPTVTPEAAGRDAPAAAACDCSSSSFSSALSAGGDTVAGRDGRPTSSLLAVHFEQAARVPLPA